MPDITLTTMVMLEDSATGHVLVQDRLLRFKGLAFPGGHVEDGESVYDCAVREVREETGLNVRNLQSCGMMHYCWREAKESGEERYFVFLYKTRDFSGELTPEIPEALHFWTSLEELKQMRDQFTPRFEKYFPLFFGEHSEAFLYHAIPGDYTNTDFVYF